MTHGIIEGWTFDAWSDLRRNQRSSLNVHGDRPHRLDITLIGGRIWATVEQGKRIAQYDVTQAVEHAMQQRGQGGLLTLDLDGMHQPPDQVWTRPGGEKYHVWAHIEQMANLVTRLGQDFPAPYARHERGKVEAQGYRPCTCVVLWRLEGLVTGEDALP